MFVRRAKKAREVMKGSLNREAELKRGLTLSSLESMGHGALGQLRRLGAGARDVAFGGRDAGKRLGGGLKKGGGGAGGKDAGRSDSKRRFSAGHGPDRRPVLRSSASETDLDDHLVRQKYLEETGAAQRRTHGSHDRQKLSSFEGGTDGHRQSWHTDDVSSLRHHSRRCLRHHSRPLCKLAFIRGADCAGTPARSIHHGPNTSPPPFMQPVR
jgi:hypothetical protein